MKKYLALIILVLFLGSPLIKSVEAMTLENFIQNYQIPIKPGYHTSETPLYGVSSGTFSEYDLSSLWIESNGFDHLVYDPTAGILGIDLINLSPGDEVKFEIKHPTEPIFYAFEAPTVRAQENVVVKAGEPFNEVIYNTAFGDLKIGPEGITSSQGSIYGETIVSGTVQTPGKYPVLILSGGNANLGFYTYFILEVTESGTANAPDVNKDYQWTQEGQISFEDAFTQWSNGMLQKYQSTTDQPDLTLNGLHLFENAVPTIVYDGQVVDTTLYDKKLEPGIFNIVYLTSNLNDPNKTDTHSYIFAIKDGVGYPFYIDMPSSTEQFNVRVTANDELKKIFKQHVERYVVELESTNTSNSDSGYRIIAPSESLILRVDISQMEILDEVPYLNEDSYIELGSEIDETFELKNLIYENNDLMPRLLIDDIPRESKQYSTVENVITYTFDFDQPVIELKKDEPFVLDLGPKTDILYSSFSHLHHAVINTDLLPLSVVVGTPSKPGEYELIIQQHNTIGSSTYIFQKIIVSE